MIDIAVFSATQRMGSTLVQRIFNANPNTMVWGECGRIVQNQFNCYQGMRKFSFYDASTRGKYFAAGRPTTVNVANLSPEIPIIDNAASSGLRSVLENLYERGMWDRVGFKEVNHTPRAVRWFMDVVPECPLVVLIVRNAIDTYKSCPNGWNYKPSFFADMWHENVTGYRRLAREHPDRIFLFDYDKLPESCEGVMDLAMISKEKLVEVLRSKPNSSFGKHPKTISQMQKLRQFLAAKGNSVSQVV